MKKLFFIIAILNSMSLFSSDLRDGMINAKSAIFYAPNFDSIGNLPSMVLVTEFNKTASIPVNWGNIPTFYTKDNKSYATLPIKAGTSLYGTGEVTGPLLRNGKTINLWNSDNWAYQKYNGTQLYQSHPWVLGVNSDGSAFGILADNTWRQQLILSDSIRFISDGPAFRAIVIKGNSPQEVIKSLTELIGRIELPPLWALGYQQCRWSYQPDERVKEVANTFRLKKIPCDVIWIDIDYMDSFKVFTFHPTKFPDPKALNSYLHGIGFKSVWMIDPGVKAQPGYAVYDSGTKGNHWVLNSTGSAYKGDVWPGKCVFPDFTRPETRKWWAGLYTDYLKTDIDGVWNDMNEPTIFNAESGTMPTDNQHRGGGDLPQGSHLRYHNVFGSLMVKASREGIQSARPDKRPFVLSRSGFLGSHRFSATWTGDNAATSEQMKLSVPMILNLGLSGQPFSGADIGGYSGTTSATLFGQWIALGVFYPFSRAHAESGTNDKEPWAFGPEIEEVSRVAIKRRYRLMPYLYSLFHEAAATGLPVMRPLFFADPSDLSLRKEEKAFLLGNDLMIIPKWASSAAMPKGNWRTISLVGEDSKNDIYQPDVKLRDGAIIPLGKNIQNTTESIHDSLTLYVSLDNAGRASGSVYEDSGEGYAYKSGEYLISTFSAQKHGSVVKVKIRKQEGNFSILNRKYKVMIIQNNKVFSSLWTAATTIKVNIDE